MSKEGFKVNDKAVIIKDLQWFIITAYGCKTNLAPVTFRLLIDAHTEYQ